MNQIFLSVVIPCYDEMANLHKGVLEKVQRFLEKKKESYEVIIVDDGSKDGSVEFVRAFIKDNPQFRLIKNPHLGKAGSVTAGVLSATGKYILFTDMDQATPIEEVNKLLPYFSSPAGGFDIVIGSRNNSRKGAPMIRLFISRANIVLRKLIIGIPDISDTQCGFKMFKKEVAQKLFTKVKDLHHGFRSVSGSSVSSGFDVELLYIATQMGLSIKEVPVTWLYVETRRVNPITDSIEGVLDLFRIKRNAISGKYKNV